MFLAKATFRATLRTSTSRAIRIPMRARGLATPADVTIQSEPVAVLRKAEHAVISVFDMFSIGIGPSSSHTVGPMRAAKLFIDGLNEKSLLPQIESLKITLYGSLSATGSGHYTPQAVLLGLGGASPESVDTGKVTIDWRRMLDGGRLELDGRKMIKFDVAKDLDWCMDNLPAHPNGMSLTAFDGEGDMVATNVYYSVGGGFVMNDAIKFSKQYINTDPIPAPGKSSASTKPEMIPSKDILFRNAADLIALTAENNMTISELIWHNERKLLTPSEISTSLLSLWRVMNASITEGISSPLTHLPGGLRLKRRAPGMYKYLVEEGLVADARVGKAGAGRGKGGGRKSIFPGLDTLSCYAIAVNEVNAAGGRIVTAPTNGAAGVIPAVLRYFIENMSPVSPSDDIQKFLLTAAALGMLFKSGASISAAEGGCMAEVGVASSMAAGGLVACMGGSTQQILQAAEIAIEHSMGLTCDPIGGLVQVPCIERNSIGAAKAVTSAQLALFGPGEHSVSLDDAIEAMRVTARDMHSHYKETSLGGLATSVRLPVSLPSC